MIKKIIILLSFVFLLNACSYVPNKITSVNDQEKTSPKEEKILQKYENIYAGFLLKYPSEVVLNNRKPNFPLSLTILAKKTDLLDAEDLLGFDKDTALYNQEALSKGEYGKTVDSPLEISKKTRKIGENNAQEFMVLNRFEKCDITFERKIYFFNKNNQIVITLKIDPETAKNEIKEYLTIDNENCGEKLIWDVSKQEKFYNTLKDGKGGKELQKWYTTFDEIINSIEILPELTNFDKLQGIWISDDDKKSSFVLFQNKKINFYDQKKLSEENFKIMTNEGNEDLNGEYLEVYEEKETFKYHIEDLKDNQLTLMYLPKGNILKFTKQ